MKKAKDKTGKRPYSKPGLEQVQLVAEEAVLTACKIQGGTILMPSNRNCLPNSCVAQGS
jgi:hypothetical protein